MTGKSKDRVVRWMLRGRVGLSSKMIASYLTFGIKSQYYHPEDPSDFDRCLVLLNEVPELRSELPRMSEISESWKVLVDNWDLIERSHIDEVGIGFSKSHSAPKTYKLMRGLLDPIYDRP